MQDIGLARVPASESLSKQVRTGANGRGQGLAVKSPQQNSEKRLRIHWHQFCFL